MSSDGVTREQLYALAWSEPMTQVARRYGVSSSFLARVCTMMNVPRPPMGYWTKLEFGKSVSQAPLPEATPFDLLVWTPGAALPVQRQPTPAVKAAPKVSVQRTPTRVKKPVAAGPRMHPLLRDIRTHYESGRENDNGYFRPNKKILADVVVSKPGLSSAMQLANLLYLAFEDLGKPVAFLPSEGYRRRQEVNVHEQPTRNGDYETYWHPARLTAVSIGTLAIGLTIFEICERVEMRYVRGKYYPLDQLPKMGKYDEMHSWTTHKNRCTGRFCIQAYSPYGVLDWHRQWREDKPGQLLGKVKAIATEIVGFAPELVRLYEQAERQAEIARQEREEQWRKWKEEERARQLREAQIKSKDALLASIDHWAKVKAMDAFFDDVERRAGLLPVEAERDAILANVKQAREVIGSTDALAYFKAWRYPT